MINMFKQMKIISIVGTRPQFIKIVPLSGELRKKHQEIVIHTGQYYDSKMSPLFFDELKINKPDYNLKIGSGNHSKQTGKMLMEIEKIITDSDSVQTLKTLCIILRDEVA